MDFNAESSAIIVIKSNGEIKVVSIKEEHKRHVDAFEEFEDKEIKTNIDEILTVLRKSHAVSGMNISIRLAERGYIVIIPNTISKNDGSINVKQIYLPSEPEQINKLNDCLTYSKLRDKSIEFDFYRGSSCIYSASSDTDLNTIIAQVNKKLEELSQMNR